MARLPGMKRKRTTYRLEIAKLDKLPEYNFKTGKSHYIPNVQLKKTTKMWPFSTRYGFKHICNSKEQSIPTSLHGYQLCVKRMCYNGKKPKTSQKEEVDMYCVRWHVLLDPKKEHHLKLLQEVIKTFKVNANNPGPFPFCINHFDKNTQDFFIENGYLSSEAKWKGQTGMGSKDW
jgi:hypothetical protein